MKKKLLMVSIILILSTIFMFLFINRNRDKLELKLNIRRNIADSLQLKSTIKLDKKLGFIKIISEKLYALSWSNGNQGKIFVYDIKKNFKTSTINLKQIQDTLLIIGNYDIEADTIYFHDKIKNLIAKSSINGEILKITKYNKQFSRISKVNNNFIISGWNDKYDIFFEKFNFHTGKSSKIDLNDSYLKQYKNNGIALDGCYYSNNNLTIMLPYSVNRLFIFNKNLNFSGKMDLIYGRLDFKYRGTKDQSVQVDPNNLNPNLSCFIDENNYVYILTDHSTQWNTTNKCFIDIYDLNTKSYIKSYKINDYKNSKPEEILIYNSELIVLFENNLNIYKFK